MTSAERNLLLGIAKHLVAIHPGIPLRELLEAVMEEQASAERLQAYVERTTAPRRQS